MKVRLASAAEADLAHIRDTIFSENPAAAARVPRAIARAIELRKFSPHIGRPGSVKGTREKPVKSLPYIIVYTTEDGALVDAHNSSLSLILRLSQTYDTAKVLF